MITRKYTEKGYDIRAEIAGKGDDRTADIYYNQKFIGQLVPAQFGGRNSSASGWGSFEVRMGSCKTIWDAAKSLYTEKRRAGLL
jgi:hypothetical protein